MRTGNSPRSLAVLLALTTALAGCSSTSRSTSDRPKTDAGQRPEAHSIVVEASVPPLSGTATGRPVHVESLRGRIVFSDATNDVWMVNADGSGLQRLTTNPAFDFDPAFSPDGTMIAFRSERDGNSEVYVMRADGSKPRNLSRDGDNDWGPSWSPDGRVVWNCARDLTFGFRACVAKPDGSHLQVLPIDRYVEYPAWSPDGSKIAFMSQEPGATGSDPDYNIYVANVDGTGLRRLTETPGEDGFPSWCPDGTRIAFSSTRDDCSNSDAADCKTTGDIGPYETIYVMNADGTDQRRLSDRYGMFADWSPDGRFIVFSPDLNVIRPDGTGLVRIPVSGVGGEPEFADWGVPIRA